MEYHILYVKSRKSLRGRREKILFICRVPKKTLGKLASLPSVRKITLGKALFAECRKKTLGKQANCRVFFLLSVFCATLGKKIVCRVPDK